MKKIKAIIDMDIGDDIDDAFALQYAINHPDFEILGVTVMYKNCYQRAKMARALLEKNGITDVGVYMGYDKPLVEEIKPFWYESIGKDGKANLLSWDESLEKYPIECQHAVDFMIETAKKYPGEVTLFGIGPMTNIAKAIEKAPEEMKKLKEIILMSGNRDMILEYNLMLWTDLVQISKENTGCLRNSNLGFFRNEYGYMAYPDKLEWGFSSSKTSPVEDNSLYYTWRIYRYEYKL